VAKNEQKWGGTSRNEQKNEQKKRAENGDFVVPFFPKTTLFFARFQKKGT